MKRALALILALGVPTAPGAFEMPGAARMVFDTRLRLDSYDLPIGGFADGILPVDPHEGQVTRRAWRLDGVSATSLQVLAPLRDQLVAQGYEIVFECHDTTCGGFDFRFATPVIPAPHMYVDLGDYRFLSARRADGAVASLLVSRSDAAVFVQVIRVEEPDVITPVPRSDPPPMDIADQLLAQGHVVLDDLQFQTGAETLGDGPFASLTELAGLMGTRDDVRLVFVGHTDSVGTLDNNIALSRGRAQAVRDRFLQDHDIDPDLVGAQGMGFLAPRAPNLTEAGRTQNRRVEVILLPR